MKQQKEEFNKPTVDSLNAKTHASRRQFITHSSNEMLSKRKVSVHKTGMYGTMQHYEKYVL